MLSKTGLGIAAAGAGICFIGYCVYFDHKRRSDPMFKQKLRESKSCSCRLPCQNSKVANYLIIAHLFAAFLHIFTVHDGLNRQI